jgi:hypothetical protein
MKISEKDRLRFWANVDKTAGCWVWIGSRTGRKGYGSIHIGGKRWLAHRLSYALHVEAPSPIRKVTQTCGTSRCVRPDHLEEMKKQGKAPVVTVGAFYGWWEVLSKVDRAKGKRCYLCRCLCGTVREVVGSCLRTLHSKSCGCATRKAASERRMKRIYLLDGQYWSVSELADRHSMPRGLVFTRLANGWSISRALMQPVGRPIAPVDPVKRDRRSSRQRNLRKQKNEAARIRRVEQARASIKPETWAAAQEVMNDGSGEEA